MTVTRLWLAITGALLGVGVCSCGGSATHPAASAAHPSTTTVVTTTTMTTTTSTPPRPKHRQPNPGSLLQTTQLPSSSTPGFHAEMDALWNGIRTGSMTPALPAFFPVGAYVQVKAIADPTADYKSRLLGDYRLDIAAAHGLLGAHASQARLLEVRVPGSYAHWVDPGACYNRVGYYEVPNARVVYNEAGQTRSFGIASMISWRGIWYVVHLGAVVREGSGGVVDDPSSGAGTSLPSSTC